MFTAQTLGPAYEYWLDAWQRTILTLDAMRRRGEALAAYGEQPVPNKLTFAAELVIDGRSLPQPVNFGLARIIPPEGSIADPAKPPFVVVDPRAGHGPGIGGMKQSSEIGLALQAGHPCYFIGFRPEPEPGQTIADVCRAEAAFIEEVARRHPDAASKPVVIANCQAGWQTMMTAALRPDLMGPIMVVGSPMSYWAGKRGGSPMRYLGGVLGGSWLDALTGDLGCGIFDGAWLIGNFESLNPANTFWEKGYNLYSKVDTEAPRFIDFETWWGSPVLLNAEEMQWIADNLFIGNKLSSGALRAPDGTRIDLRNVKGPIIVFCSWGDDITPPPQALGWISDLYDDEREIADAGQTIVYALHQTIGHLGIFVSGKVADKEHREFTNCMDLIDLLPPGLYEAVITEVEPGTKHPDLVNGNYLFRLEARTLEDIRKIVDRREDDDLRFAVAAEVSEINLGLYRTLVSPMVKAVANPTGAEMMRQLHPNRFRFSFLSDANPMMAPVSALADTVREHRQPVSADNPLLALEGVASAWITSAWETFRRMRDATQETFFLTTYGSPLLRAAVGIGQVEEPPGRRIERDLVREADATRIMAALDQRFEVGSPADAGLRALSYVTQAEGGFDERQFAVLKKFREVQPPQERRSFAEFKEAVREQCTLVRLDTERAIEAIPQLLANEPEKSRMALDALRKVLDARDGLSKEGRRRLERVSALFESAPQAQLESSHA